MTAIVSIMVVPAILFAVNPVIVPVVPVAIGVYNPPWCRFYHYNTWWRRGPMIIPVTMPVAIVIARIIGTIGTG
jgi:hypothetical protein